MSLLLRPGPHILRPQLSTVSPDLRGWTSGGGDITIDSVVNGVHTVTVPSGAAETFDHTARNAPYWYTPLTDTSFNNVTAGDSEWSHFRCHIETPTPPPADSGLGILFGLGSADFIADPADHTFFVAGLHFVGAAASGQLYFQTSANHQNDTTGKSLTFATFDIVLQYWQVGRFLQLYNGTDILLQNINLGPGASEQWYLFATLLKTATLASDTEFSFKLSYSPIIDQGWNV